MTRSAIHNPSNAPTHWSSRDRYIYNDLYGPDLPRDDYASRTQPIGRVPAAEPTYERDYGSKSERFRVEREPRYTHRTKTFEDLCDEILGGHRQERVSYRETRHERTTHRGGSSSFFKTSESLQRSLDKHDGDFNKAVKHWSDEPITTTKHVSHERHGGGYTSFKSFEHKEEKTTHCTKDKKRDHCKGSEKTQRETYERRREHVAKEIKGDGQAWLIDSGVFDREISEKMRERGWEKESKSSHRETRHEHKRSTKERGCDKKSRKRGDCKGDPKVRDAHLGHHGKSDFDVFMARSKGELEHSTGERPKRRSTKVRYDGETSHRSHRKPNCPPKRHEPEGKTWQQAAFNRD